MLNNTMVKFFGWVLLIAGIAIIIVTLYYSYSVFIGKTEIQPFFAAENKESPAPAADKKTFNPADIQKEMEKAISEQLKSLLPADTIPKFLNLFVWTIFAWIFVFGGAQISGLGIRLLKN